MAFVNYYSVNGSILGEQPVGGARVDYLTDALGSVTATVDQTGTVQNTYWYKPYGELLAKTGAAEDPKFMWVGSQGYRTTKLVHSSTYVRARHYGSLSGRWITKDPAKFQRWLPYVYVSAQPSVLVDPTGLSPTASVPTPPKTSKFPEQCKTGCPDNVRNEVATLCSDIQTMLTGKMTASINSCLEKAYQYSGTTGCSLLDQTRIQCMQKFCSGKDNVTCIDCSPLGNDSDTPGVIPCGNTPSFQPPASNPINPVSGVELCKNSPTFAPDGSFYCAGCSNDIIPVVGCVFLHELGHACGIAHGHYPVKRYSLTCNALFSCCLGAALEGKDDGQCYNRGEDIY